jgi:hypothetical protein
MIENIILIFPLIIVIIIFYKISTIKKTKQDDYLDWSKIPIEYNYVFIDEKPSILSNGFVMWKSGVPIACCNVAYFRDGLWYQKANIFVPKESIYVPKEAIIGSLPEPKNSLRKRPQCIILKNL